MKKSAIIKVLSAVIALVMLLSGCAVQTTEEITQPTQSLSGELLCLQISRFSGEFVEDGSDEKVENVAAILVANDTDTFLDLAVITYQVGDRTATFQVTGLPSGEKAWVLEKNRMSISEGDELVFEDCQSTYNPKAMLKTADLEMLRQGNTISVTNVSDKALSNACIYYKNRLEDGNYFGGISYLINFGELAPGETVQRSAAHFGDESDIVRYSYQA